MDPTFFERIRQDFPILQRSIYGKPLVYMDNGATTQKPQEVIDCISEMYSTMNANIHRGVHFLSEQVTEIYEDARRTMQEFIHAAYAEEIVFTRGATDGINAVAFSFGEAYVKPGDEIIVSEMEHHSDIVPWQMMCDRKKAHLRVIPIFDDGTLDLDTYRSLLNEKTRLVAVTQVSNTLGTVNPLHEIIRAAHANGSRVLVDAAQSVQHMPIDVQELDCDFLAFSGHKVYGPTGVGVLYGKRDLLNAMPPYQGGGDMISCVTFEHTTYNELPLKFEAGTNNYIDAAGLACALKYIGRIGLPALQAQEKMLTAYALERLTAIPGLRIFGQAPERTAIFSFLVGDIHPYDMGMVLDKLGIAVRTGTHCTQPLMDHFNIDGTVRASLVFYNTREEIDRLAEGIERAKKLLA